MDADFTRPDQRLDSTTEGGASRVSFEVIDLGTFVRQWAVQSPKIGWLLGAGASAAARGTNRNQIMMDLLLRMYADAHRLVRQTLSLSEDTDVHRIRAITTTRTACHR